jgi:hypothetical protein
VWVLAHSAAAPALARIAWQVGASPPVAGAGYPIRDASAAPSQSGTGEGAGRLVHLRHEEDEMNGAGGPARRRAGLLASAVTGAALVAAACGGSSTTSAGLPSLQTITAQALAYAKCMRSHGVPNFPDPTVQDNARNKGVGFSFARSGPGAIDTSSPAFRSAAKACQRQTGFGQISQAQLHAAMSVLLKFAECMRSHGIANFPDPYENSHQVGFSTTGLDQNSARFKAASKACRPLLPGGGP